MIQKRCHTLENILRDTLLPDGCEGQLLLLFGRHLQFRPIGKQELEDEDWSGNESEVKVRISDSH